MPVPANPQSPRVPSPPRLSGPESPPLEEVLNSVPSKEEVIESAQSTESIVSAQPSVDELLGRNR